MRFIKTKNTVLVAVWGFIASADAYKYQKRGGTEKFIISFLSSRNSETVVGFHFAEKRNFLHSLYRLVKSLSSVRCGSAHFLMAASRAFSFLLRT